MWRAVLGVKAWVNPKQVREDRNKHRDQQAAMSAGAGVHTASTGQGSPSRQ
jgi:hypothetical protein